MSEANHESSLRGRRMIYWYIGFLLLLSIGIALMPFSLEIKENTRLLTYCTGSAFWIGILGIVYCALKINKCRKRSLRFREQDTKQKQLGLVHFLQNKPAMVADVAMFVSLIGFFIIKMCWESNTLSFALLAIFIFSFGMHCMLNGISYKFIICEKKKGNVL